MKACTMELSGAGRAIVVARQDGRVLATADELPCGLWQIIADTPSLCGRYRSREDAVNALQAAFKDLADEV